MSASLSTQNKEIKWTAVVELLIAAGFWGFGFIAATWALEALDAFEITFMRFAIASLIGLPFVLARGARHEWRLNLKLSAIPALFLASTLILQTWGLQTTTATKSGFITTLYVVIVPLLEAFMLGRKLSGLVWLCVFTALVGTAMIVDLGLVQINLGDVLTLGCAFTAAGQIYWMGLVSPKIGRPFVFNIYQCLWSVGLTAPFIHWQTLGTKVAHVNQWSPHAIIGLSSLAVGSTVIAFFLQVRAQAKISPTVSSLMFLLESPFAMIFAIMLLGESLKTWEALGAALIFLSALTATAAEAKKTTTPDPEK